MRLAAGEKKRKEQMRTGRMVAPHIHKSTQTLFCNVKPLRTIRVVIPASEKFAQDRVISATFKGSDTTYEIESEERVGNGMCSRLLDAFGFDMPTCEIILEHANKTFFRLFTQFCAANMNEK